MHYVFHKHKNYNEPKNDELEHNLQNTQKNEKQNT
jgi:hypothetical protein